MQSTLRDEERVSKGGDHWDVLTKGDVQAQRTAMLELMEALPAPVPFVAEESGESCLSPSKMTSQSEMRGQAGLGGKNIQEKLNKKPTAADRIVEKLGMQIKKESLEVINEPKSGRPGKVSDRSSRRISKEAEITRTDLSAPRNTQQSSFPPPPLVKQESKSKSFTSYS